MNNPTIEVTQADQWRKKPVVITAVQINTQEDAEGYLGICTGGTACKSKGAPDGAWPHIHTLEGDHTWTPGDWCITGVQGEQYFCKPDIFAQTYEPAHRIASTRTVDTELLEALKEQVGECFDPLCDMCARHQDIITKAEAGL